jgi:anti-sigma regulatory factor (Ser/Thr protein kinase)
VNEVGKRHTLSRQDVTIVNLRRLREVTRWAAQQAGLTPRRAERFEMAVHEAATNVVCHGGGQGRMEIIQDDQERLIVKVTDHGPGLPADLKITRPAPDAPRGRGLWLARSLCDRLKIYCDHTGTTVSLEMLLNAR